MKEKLQKPGLDVVGAGQVVDGGDGDWDEDEGGVQHRAWHSFWRVNCQEICKYVPKTFWSLWLEKLPHYQKRHQQLQLIQVVTTVELIPCHIEQMPPQHHTCPSHFAVPQCRSDQTYCHNLLISKTESNLAGGVPILVGATILQWHLRFKSGKHLFHMSNPSHLWNTTFYLISHVRSFALEDTFCEST